jgi:hypothetical protein
MAGKALPLPWPITQSILKSILRYDPETGVFVWLVARGKNSRIGEVAGGPGSEGYWRIWIDGRFYQAHRLAWLYMTGEWPSAQVDHENVVPNDNRWDNIRGASQSQNKANSRTYRNNALGIKGVRLHSNGQYEARLRVNGKLQYLGCFRTIEAAKAAYDAEAKKQFGHFARAS